MKYMKLYYLIFILLLFILFLLFFIKKYVNKISYIFFYGSLRKNEFNYNKIKNNNLIKYLGNGITNKKFSFIMEKDTKWLPFITEKQYNNYKKTPIIGDLYEINNDISIFDRIKFLYQMDNFEYRYNREIVEIIWNNQIKYAYIYVIKDYYISEVKNKFYIQHGNYSYVDLH